MKKFWMIYTPVNDGRLPKFDTYQEAEDEAKRRAADRAGDGEFFILEAIASTKKPVPDIEVIKL